MDSVKFTLYEIAGYLLPGSVSLLSLLIGYSLINDNSIHFQFSSVEVVVLMIVAYFMGHVNQAIGNFFCSFFEVRSISKRSESIAKLKDKLNIGSSLSDREAFAIIMNVSLAKFKIEAMDIFTEREGFYRGSTVGFILLSISLIVSLYFNDLNYFNGASCLQLSKAHKIFLLIVSIISGVLFFLRYLRFLTYRINVMIDAHN